MKHNTLAVFITNNQQIQHIPKIRNEFDQLHDICIVTDTNVHSDEYAIIPLFYIKFFTGHVVFLSINDYLNNRNYFPSNQISLAVTQSDLYSSNIDIAKLDLYKVIKL